MSKFQMIEPDQANEQVKALYEKSQQKFGGVPNVFKIMAHSPSVLQSFLSMACAMSESKLPKVLQGKIALHISDANACGYCIAAHSAMSKAEGLSDEDSFKARKGFSKDPKEQAALKLAKLIHVKNGFVSCDDIKEAREAGLEDECIMAIVGVVIQTLFGNIVNHVAGTAIDFPEPPCPSCKS